jgi:hypothetical protein
MLTSEEVVQVRKVLSDFFWIQKFFESTFKIKRYVEKAYYKYSLNL